MYIYCIVLHRGALLLVPQVRLVYCFTPYQRLWLYNGSPLVAFYDTLGIRRTYFRLKPPVSSMGCWCHSDSPSVLLYFTFLSHLFPLPYGTGSTVPLDWFDSVLLCLFLVCCGCDTSYIVWVHIQCQAYIIYILPLCRGHSWRVRLAVLKTLTPPGHLISPLVCRGP